MPSSGAQLQHDAQQGRGIGPAGDRQAYPVAGMEKILAADAVENALDHLFHGDHSIMRFRSA